MAISYVGSATGTNSATIPTHQAGDLLIAFAFRVGSTTAPTLPSGWNQIASNNTSGISQRMAWRYAVDGSTVSGTWTNATELVIGVYRGALIDWTETITGNSSSGVNYANNIIYPNETVWYVGTIGHRLTDTSVDVAPTGMTNRTSFIGTGEVALHDTNGTNSTSTWPLTNQTVGGTSSSYISNVTMLREQPVGTVFPIPPTSSNGFTGSDTDGVYAVSNGTLMNGGRDASNAIKSPAWVVYVPSTIESIPSGKVVNKATLFVAGRNTVPVGSGNYGTLYANAADNTNSLSTTNHPATFTPTVANVPVTSANTHSFDVTDIVNEIFARPGWFPSASSAIGFYIDGSTAPGANNYLSYSGHSISGLTSNTVKYAARLVIDTSSPPPSGSSNLTFSSSAKLQNSTPTATGSTTASFYSIAKIIGFTPASGIIRIDFVPVSNLIGFSPASGDTSFSFVTNGMLFGNTKLQGQTSSSFLLDGSMLGLARGIGLTNIAFSSTSFLKGYAPTLASSTITFTLQGEMLGTIPIQGNTQTTFTVSGITFGTGHLSGASDLVFTEISDLLGLIPINGNSPMSFSLSAKGLVNQSPYEITPYPVRDIIYSLSNATGPLTLPQTVQVPPIIYEED